VHGGTAREGKVVGEERLTCRRDDWHAATRAQCRGTSDGPAGPWANEASARRHDSCPFGIGMRVTGLLEPSSDGLISQRSSPSSYDDEDALPGCVDVQGPAEDVRKCRVRCGGGGYKPLTIDGRQRGLSTCGACRPRTDKRLDRVCAYGSRWGDAKRSAGVQSHPHETERLR